MRPRIGDGIPGIGVKRGRAIQADRRRRDDALIRARIGHWRRVHRRGHGDLHRICHRDAAPLICDHQREHQHLRRRANRQRRRSEGRLLRGGAAQRHGGARALRPGIGDGIPSIGIRRGRAIQSNSGSGGNSLIRAGIGDRIGVGRLNDQFVGCAVSQSIPGRIFDDGGHGIGADGTRITGGDRQAPRRARYDKAGCGCVGDAVHLNRQRLTRCQSRSSCDGWGCVDGGLRRYLNRTNR